MVSGSATKIPPVVVLVYTLSTSRVVAISFTDGVVSSLEEDSRLVGDAVD